MISKIEFIDKNNIATGTVAKSYTSVYDFEYPTQKFNEDYNWFATSPSSVSFSLIFDSWIEDNIFNETHPTLKNPDGTPLSNDSGRKFNRHVVRIYDDEVLFFEGIITVEDLDWNIDSNMIKLVVNDYLILFTDIQDIEYDITTTTTFAVGRSLLNEPFLQQYAHDIYNLLRVVKTTAEQQYFNPNYVKFNIEKDEAILRRAGENKVINFRGTWIWQDLVFSLSLFQNEPNNGWYDAEIRTFDAHTGVEQLGGTFNLVWGSYQGASAVEAAINGVLFQGGMIGQTWKANYSYAQSVPATPLAYRLYRLEKVEQPIGDYDEYRVYRNVINLDTNPDDDNEQNGHEESTNSPVLINTVLDFTVKQQAPYEDYVKGTIDGVDVSYFEYADALFALTHLTPNRLSTRAMFRLRYDIDGDDLVVRYFRISNTYLTPTAITVFQLRQETHIYRNYSEVISEQEIVNYNEQILGYRDITTWINDYYEIIGLDKSNFDTAQIWEDRTFRLDGYPTDGDSSFVSGIVNIPIETETSNYIITVGRYFTNGTAYDWYIRFSLKFKGYAATPYLNYTETLTTTDVLKIITVLNNCSYYCKLNTFYVSDKDYVLDASSETILSSDMIELNKSRVWSANIDESIYDKLLVFDTKIFKKFVEDYYNLKFFSKVKQLISFKLSTIFNGTVINLGSRLSFLGKDYIVSSWKKMYENIFEITAFNDTLTVLQFSNDGTTLNQAELSNNGTLLNTWNVKEI